MLAPKIKICGVNSADALEAAIAARADFVGFNFFPPSPRFLAPAQAQALGAQAAGRIPAVGVFVDADDRAIAEKLALTQLDAIQLHGSEPPERAAELRARHGRPVWKVISVAKRDDLARADAYVGAADFVLFDAKTPKGALPGGMGLAFDWSLLNGWRGALPWGLAGGLSLSNVSEAVLISGAPLVDVSSGVEGAAGQKDPGMIAAFCAVAQAV